MSNLSIGPVLLNLTNMTDQASIERRASHVKLLLLDCDGVLTDGRLWLLQDGDEHKAFNTKDGLGLELLRRAGLRAGVITGRTSTALARRAKELGIEFLRQGNEQKIAAFEEVLRSAGVEDDEVAFVGDDLSDIPLMRRSEFAVAVADAVAETRAAAHYVTQAKGGRGAVREVIEIILKSQGRWHELIEDYLK
jgi:3-deoxy-D-manno-octulosonate 8-phosphate phosphatase (KDO 8-P phosphatase)